MRILDKKPVLPGDFLGTEEEFEPGKNAFEEQGQVFSSAVGKAVFDSGQKTVQVLPNRELRPIEVGAIVVAKVVLVKSNMVMVELLQAEKDGLKMVFGQSFAVLPARNISRHFIKNLRNAFKIGDLVKAEVATVTSYSIDLRTNKPELGVIKAFCAVCRSGLQLFGSELKCVSCGNPAERKLSTEYLLR